MQYSVKLQSFEGPLDLLLHLIQKNDLDLYDIPVKEITDQYMIYIHTMQVLQLDIASEYLVMAATLLHMKSQMLLPAQENELDDEDFEYEEGDPREELMQRLIEYKKFKEAAGDLKERERARSDLFSKPMSDLSNLLSEPLEEEEKANYNVTIYDMLQAFQNISKRNRKRETVFSKIQREDIPIDEKMTQIMNELDLHDGKRKFSELFDREEDKNHMVIAFLALLELMKANAVFCYQDSNFDEIMIYQKGALTVEKS
ncbi:segregation/condensation protein A [Evansella tamaricis]|uniref:Segregation and condensation protein A n=1 Tax=Evansella tamaricis TaxID=2069301 RepID=A0ABS6JM78_9BACI|nr:segregation/condensation protein A [Evansella tamaricis]MBU9714779.1 segregation/condensation protein A [Evansella tamaricis]